MTAIAGTVILYNPDLNLEGNIDSYFDLLSLLIIVDNSEIPESSHYLKFINHEKVIIVINNDNKGICNAINTAAKIATAKGFEWLLTMDQDSAFTSNMFESYLHMFASLESKSTVAVIGIEHDSLLHKETENKKTGNSIIPVNKVITSGSLNNLTIFQKLNGYDERLFIDEADHEYCFRAKINHYEILKCETILLTHSIGTRKEIRLFTGNNIGFRKLHSPVRLYYMVRNRCYIFKTYKKAFPSDIKSSRKDLFVTIKNNLLFGNKRLQLIRYIVSGYFDFLNKRYYKFQKITDQAKSNHLT